MLRWWRLIVAVTHIAMVRNRCIRSFVVSSLVVSAIIVSQLFLFDDTASDTERFWRESDIIITDGEREWNHQRAIESFSFLCPNCTFTDLSSINRTNDNDTMHSHETFYRFLRRYIHRLNYAQIIRNLDKFDLQANSDGSLVIVIQVLSFHWY